MVPRARRPPGSAWPSGDGMGEDRRIPREQDEGEGHNPHVGGARERLALVSSRPKHTVVRTSGRGRRARSPVPLPERRLGAGSRTRSSPMPIGERDVFSPFVTDAAEEDPPPREPQVEGEPAGTMARSRRRHLRRKRGTGRQRQRAASARGELGDRRAAEGPRAIPNRCSTERVAPLASRAAIVVAVPGPTVRPPHGPVPAEAPRLRDAATGDGVAGERPDGVPTVKSPRRVQRWSGTALGPAAIADAGAERRHGSNHSHGANDTLVRPGRLNGTPRPLQAFAVGRRRPASGPILIYTAG